MELFEQIVRAERDDILEALAQSRAMEPPSGPWRHSWMALRSQFEKDQESQLRLLDQIIRRAEEVRRMVDPTSDEEAARCDHEWDASGLCARCLRMDYEFEEDAT